MHKLTNDPAYETYKTLILSTRTKPSHATQPAARVPERGPSSGNGEFVSGRPMFRPNGECFYERFPYFKYPSKQNGAYRRTAACTKGRRLCILTSTGGLSPKDLCGCMKKLCNWGKSVLLDGGNSTAFYCWNYGDKKPNPWFKPGRSEVTNYIVLCGKGKCPSKSNFGY
ncbi:MAG: phosphodiester glycosidase family protein [Armatimonadetes bacterium]|nr:phosphodiester glycosidase family protein [Armatimonadota bacterium]